MRKGNESVAGCFPTTHWSLVGRATRDATLVRREALENLLRRYLPALRAHLVRVRRLSVEDADDLLQEFVTAKIVERDLLDRADRELGRFRSYLLTALNRFRIDRLRQQGAKKRAPEAGALLGDANEHIEGPASCDIFDTEWARNVIAEALEQMRAECETSGRDDLWGIFEARLLKPMLHGDEPVDYGELVQRLGLRSAEQASNVLITAKRMFARTMRQVVGRYALSDEEIEAELRELYEVLARSRT